METANQYEQAWWGNGKRRIVGIDEAGRGPIAGPLVVAGVIFPVGYHHEAIYDSKKVSEKKREALYEVMRLPIISKSSIRKRSIARIFIGRHRMRCSTLQRYLPVMGY